MSRPGRHRRRRCCCRCCCVSNADDAPPRRTRSNAALSGICCRRELLLLLLVLLLWEEPGTTASVPAHLSPTPPPPPPPSFACGATAPCCDYEQGAKSDDKVPGLPVDKIFFRLSSRSIFESQLLAVKIAERLYHYRHPPPPPANTAATPTHLFNHGQGIRRGRQERRQGQGRRAEEAGHALRARCPKLKRVCVCVCVCVCGGDARAHAGGVSERKNRKRHRETCGAI